MPHLTSKLFVMYVTCPAVRCLVDRGALLPGFGRKNSTTSRGSTTGGRGRPTTFRTCGETTWARTGTLRGNSQSADTDMT